MVWLLTFSVSFGYTVRDYDYFVVPNVVEVPQFGRIPYVGNDANVEVVAGPGAPFFLRSVQLSTLYEGNGDPLFMLLPPTGGWVPGEAYSLQSQTDFSSSATMNFVATSEPVNPVSFLLVKGSTDELGESGSRRALYLDIDMRGADPLAMFTVLPLEHDPADGLPSLEFHSGFGAGGHEVTAIQRVIRGGDEIAFDPECVVIETRAADGKAGVSQTVCTSPGGPESDFDGKRGCQTGPTRHWPGLLFALFGRR